MKLSLLPLFLFLFTISSSFSQTYTGTGGPLHDDNTLSDFTIEVQGLVPDALNTTHGLTNVCINLTHTWDSDLDIRLIAPDGTNIMLSSGKGDDGDNYTNTCFDMHTTEHIINGYPPFTGNYRPFTTLGNANNGSSGNGIWTLRIFDIYAYADSGEMLDWSITFGNAPASPFPFASSTFPIILLTTDNITVPNEPKISGKIKVIDNAAGLTNHLSDAPAFEGFMGIEVRGSSSQMFPKKNFSMEIRDSLGVDLATSLLGLPEEEDWILYAPYTDKSFLRDALTYKLGNDEGRYAPRTRFCELFLNGDFQGMYCLEEKIKRDKNRVNISKLTPADTLGDQVTGGYLIKVDRDEGDGSFFVSNYTGTYDNPIRIVYEDPEGFDLHPRQIEYIQHFFNEFETALYGDDFMDPAIGYRKYADVSSFIDYFIINEVGHNVDGYRLSTFLYKDRDSKDSLLHAGPLWDFNLCYGNVNYCNSENTADWAYTDSGNCDNTPLWWKRLLEDTSYQNQLQCRYQYLRGTILSDASIHHYLDSMETAFSNAQSRNYDRWPILGVYVWPNYFVGQTYHEEVKWMKNWIDHRLEWMDDNLPGLCLSTATNDIDENQFSIVPNPADDRIHIHSSLPEQIRGYIEITDITGTSRMSRVVDANEEIDVSSLAAGTYFITLKGINGKIIREKFVVVR